MGQERISVVSKYVNLTMKSVVFFWVTLLSSFWAFGQGEKAGLENTPVGNHYRRMQEYAWWQPSPEIWLQRGIEFFESLNYEKAEESFLEAKSQFMRRDGKVNEGVGRSLYWLGRICATKHRYAEALRHYEEALEVLLEACGEKNEYVAECYDSIGAGYCMQAEYAKALKSYQKALRIDSVIESFNLTRNVGRDYSNIADIYFSQGEFSKALDNYKKALEIETGTTPAEVLNKDTITVPSTFRIPVGEGIVYHKIGSLYLVQGEYAKALENYRKALGINLLLYAAEKGVLLEGPIEYGKPISTWDFYLVQKRYMEDLEDFHATIKAEEESCVPLFLKGVSKRTHLEMAKYYGSIGVIYANQGEYAKALENYRRALKIHLAIYKDTQGIHPDVAADYNHIAGIYSAWGEYTKALENLHRALEINLKVFKDISGIHPCVAGIYGNIGLVYAHQGTHAKALENLQKGLGIELQVFGEDHPSLSAIYDNLGSVYSEQGKYMKALKKFQIALEVLAAEKLEPTKSNPWPNPQPVKFSIPDLGAVILADKGHLFQQLAEESRKKGKKREEIQYLKEAISAHEISIELMESLRTRLAGGEESRISFMRGRISPYNMIIKALLRLNELEKRKDWDREAFHYLERKRARALLDILSESKAEKISGIPDEILQKKKNLQLKEGALRAELTEAYSQEKRNQVKINNLQIEIDRVNRQIIALRKEIGRKYPQYISLKQPKIVGGAKIRRIVDNNTAVIEYCVGEDFINFWVITKRKMKLYRLPNNKIGEEIGKYREKICYPNLGEDKDMATKLYCHVVGDSLDTLNVKKLVIMLDGPLYKLPFSCLGKRDKKGKFHYLVENYDISYTQSASVYKTITAQRISVSNEQCLLAMANPVFKLKESPKEEKPKTDREIKLIAEGLRRRGRAYREDYLRLGYAFEKLKPLPESEGEIEAISKILGGRQCLYTKTRASERELKSLSNNGRLREFRYLHFATHGFFVEEVPALSCVVLAKDGIEDGFLTVGEIFGLNLNCELVTLSACETGLGLIETGEGIVGFTRALMYAGTPSILVSLWQVESGSTRMLMESFYRCLKQGLPKDEALRRAKISLWSKSVTDAYGNSFSCQAPFFWAPFVLYGLP